MMKKIVGMILIIAMFTGITAFADEAILTLHSGVQFGMTIEEVQQLEEDAGFMLVPRGKLSEGGPVASIPFLTGGYFLWERATLAGFDADVHYAFTDNALWGVSYEFWTDAHGESNSAYVHVLETLESKYGETEYNEETSKRYNLPAKNGTSDEFAFNAYSTGVGIASEQNYFYGTILGKKDFNAECTKYSQWLVELGDGSVVLIEHYLVEEDDMKDCHGILYTYFSADEVENSTVDSESLTDGL